MSHSITRLTTGKGDMKQIIFALAAMAGMYVVSGCHSNTSIASNTSQAAANYELRGISIGMTAEQALASAQAHDMAIGQSAARPGDVFQVLILQDKSVKSRAAGDDNAPGSGIAMTLRVNLTKKKVVWIEAGQVGPGDLLQAAKLKFGPGREGQAYPNDPADSCMGSGATNMRLGQVAHVWGDCRGPHVEFYSKNGNNYNGLDTLLIVDPDGLKVPHAAPQVPKLE